MKVRYNGFTYTVGEGFRNIFKNTKSSITSIRIGYGITSIGSNSFKSEYERLKPNDKEGIVEFLCSDLFKGIGEKKANNLLLYFKTVAKIKNATPEDLGRVPGISKKDAQKIFEHFKR